MGMTDARFLLPDGFRYAGLVSRLRSEPNRRDLAVIVSDRPAVAAGVFTQNLVSAAPVQISRQRVPQEGVRGLVVCSGNANACTGEVGLQNARRMTELVALQLGCDPHAVLVASTGVIGRQLPMPILEAGIPQATAAVAPGWEAFTQAADAILTTDTVRKLAAALPPSSDDSGPVVVGFAKGAAMIGPNLATMLGFLFSDASVAPSDLQAILRDAAAETFNCVSVEGHTSTNDTVFALANGTGPRLQGRAREAFAGQVRQVCESLALQIAQDAEGAQHFVTIQVRGLKSFAAARQVAKAVAESPLVKTAIYGADPNWGRVVSAAGYAGVAFAESELSLDMGPFRLYDHGTPLPFDAAAASAYLRSHREVEFILTFEQGTANCTFYTCDLTESYVQLNADYTT